MPLARPCRCPDPLWDGESCVRCGRMVYGAPERRQTPWRSPRKEAWTHAGVIRAIKAFAFFRGRAPLLADWDPGLGPEWPPLTTVVGLFGSFSAAVDAAKVIG